MAEIKIEGLDKLEKQLKKNATLNKVRTVVRKCGADLQGTAQRKAPVGTPASTGIPGYVGGTLKRSIGLELSDSGMTAEVEPTVEYAPYVEYGTRYMKAKPYLKPALEEVEPKFKAKMKELVK